MTNPLTQRVEKAFYSRCPPESRPTFLFEDSEKLSSTGTHEPPDDVSRVSSKQPEEKIEKDVEATAGRGDTEKTQTEPQTGKKDKKEKADKAEKKAEPKTLQGGIQVDDHKVGAGPKAKAGDTVSMRYIGKLTNGKMFDQNTKGKPVSVLLNNNVRRY